MSGSAKGAPVAIAFQLLADGPARARAPVNCRVQHHDRDSSASGNAKIGPLLMFVGLDHDDLKERNNELSERTQPRPEQKRKPYRKRTNMKGWTDEQKRAHNVQMQREWRQANRARYNELMRQYSARARAAARIGRQVHQLLLASRDDARPVNAITQPSS